MRLIELDPQWITRDGVRLGFVFRNPVRRERGWWVSCFFKPTPESEQEALIGAVLGDDALVQQCNPTAGWKVISSAVDAASFETLSVHPSLDGGPNFWHGHITAGAIVGGI